MAWEDALMLAIHCENEAKELEQKRPHAGSAAGQGVERTVYKQRKRVDGAAQPA